MESESAPGPRTYGARTAQKSAGSATLLLILLTCPWGDMSRLTYSSTSRKSSLRRYLIPSRLHPICPVTYSTSIEVTILLSTSMDKWKLPKHKFCLNRKMIKSLNRKMIKNCHAEKSTHPTIELHMVDPSH